jgi:hypothetical protein
MKCNRNGLDPHQIEFTKLLEANAYRHRPHEVFRDFCELAALAMSNAVDRAQFERREARYLDIVKRYERAEVERFPQMIACIVMSLEAGFRDCLGELFMALEFGNEWKGQFFTPYPISQLMARMVTTDAHARIEQEGFIRVEEPAVGAGGMVIAVADALLAEKINYQKAMHVTATDVDATAVHMAYIQFSLLHIPAILVHGNSLSQEKWEHWVTPAHVLGFWDVKLARRSREQTQASPAAVPVITDELTRVRETVVAQRIETGEQMSLFA